MTQDELDIKLRNRFIDTLDNAIKYANQQRDIEALGQLTQLIGTCIDWDKEIDKEQMSVGFQPKEKNKEKEDE